jgi:hypothetical protein
MFFSRIIISFLFFISSISAYVFFRSNSVIFLNSISTNYKLINKYTATISNYYPDFSHPIVFILLTSLFFENKRVNYLIITLMWMIINFSFEIGQLIFKETTLINFPLFSQYFKYGTFDSYDLVFIFLGSVSGYFFLSVTSKHKEEPA